MIPILKPVLNNIIIKVIALLLAIITWSYVYNENQIVVKEKGQKSQRFAAVAPIISKKLPVKAIFVGEPLDGAKLVEADVKIDPEYIVVAGPKEIVAVLDKLDTEPIDLAKIKKSSIYDAGIASFSPGFSTDNMRVKVTIPIRKQEAVAAQTASNNNK